MPLVFKTELNYQTFRQFAESNAAYAFMQALTATHNERKSEKLASGALFNVLKNKKHFDAEEKPIDEHTAIDISLRSLLSRKEKDALDNAPTAEKSLDEFLADDENAKGTFTVYPPDAASRNKIISKACTKAESITPKYAPMYTGTKSGIILLIVLVFICAAIYFVWNDPADLLTDKSPTYDSSGTAVSVPSSGLIDIKFEETNISQTVLPVKIYISGPDSKLVSAVTYSAEGSSVISSAYQCGDKYWVMTVNSDEYIKVNVKGSGGLDVVKYYRPVGSDNLSPKISVTDSVSTDSHYIITVAVDSFGDTCTVSTSDIVDIENDGSGSYIISVPCGSEKILDFCNSSGMSASLYITGDGNAVVSPCLALNEISIGHDAVKEIDLTPYISAESISSINIVSSGENLSASIDESNILTLTSLNNFTGIDSIVLSLEDSYGHSSEISVPIIVVNSAPYYADATKLYASVPHTPTNTGYLFSALSASDLQNDKLTYTLTNQTDCSVTLSPNGSFMLFIDPDYRGHTASFDFTVSDGILTTAPYRYTVSLNNSILASETYTQEFVCYTGENGWYTIDLPSTDSDGDTLDWSVVTELGEDGRTPEGNYVSFANGFSTVIIRPNPEINEKFSETLTFTCSDGWLSSDSVTVECKFTENKAPKAGTENHAEIPSSETTGTFLLDIRDDCEFDMCRIIQVISCTGGEIVENIGWNALEFTVNFDSSLDTADPVEVVLLVEDVVTKETVEVTYTITRQE